ncbi:hypothetical protein PL9214500218 [Planktothrix tepida PCC 9214]|uniref:Uncharacterized protein n=1 Tax=Planktothrix tepida PCC 9214 TaxID=671072 RepID=A0A1J1LKG3_9CYAN|nr:hypothetical protein PL9214500218 [Planktothrix tepida PCC 9214]
MMISARCFWGVAISILQQKKRQGCGKNPILIPVWVGLQIALEGFVQRFRNFGQDAYTCVHETALIGVGTGQCTISTSGMGWDSISPSALKVEIG